MGQTKACQVRGGWEAQAPMNKSIGGLAPLRDPTPALQGTPPLAGNIRSKADTLFPCCAGRAIKPHPSLAAPHMPRTCPAHFLGMPHCIRTPSSAHQDSEACPSPTPPHRVFAPGIKTPPLPCSVVCAPDGEAPSTCGMRTRCQSPVHAEFACQAARPLPSLPQHGTHTGQ